MFPGLYDSSKIFCIHYHIVNIYYIILYCYNFVLPFYFKFIAQIAFKKRSNVKILGPQFFFFYNISIISQHRRTYPSKPPPPRIRSVKKRGFFFSSFLNVWSVLEKKNNQKLYFFKKLYNLIIHTIWSWYQGNKIQAENQCRILFCSKGSNKNWSYFCWIVFVSSCPSLYYFIWFDLHLRGKLILEFLAHFIPV